MFKIIQKVKKHQSIFFGLFWLYKEYIFLVRITSKLWLGAQFEKILVQRKFV